MSKYVITVGANGFIRKPDDYTLAANERIQNGKPPGNPVWDAVTEQLIEKPESVLLEEAKKARHQDVKAEAEKRIAALVGADPANEKELWQKENNAQARATYLARRESQGIATAEELAEIEMLQNIGLQGLAIREASNAIEADIDMKATAEEVETYDIAGSPLWP